MNGIIAWFVRNHVAANLLMIGIVIAGLGSIPSIKQTIWPDFEINYISATVVYPGASPSDVEKSVTLRLEEEIQDVESIEEIRATANEGATNLTIELDDSADLGRALTEIGTRIDGIDTLPEEAEQPIVSELAFSYEVLSVAVHGDADERTLTRIGQDVRDGLAALPGVSKVRIAGVRPYEISIEVSEAALQRYGLRFDDVARAVRRSSIDLPGGSVKTDAGEILLRTEGQVYRGEEFARIPLVTRADGSRVVVGDVGTVIDGFEEGDKFSRFDGNPAVMIDVFRVGKQQVTEISRVVHAYLERAQAAVPEGVKLTVWDDDSQYLSDRLAMMTGNAVYGFLLVVVLLALFLKLRAAFWVALGVPISVCGALALMPFLELDINLLTAFSFIMALGILVDDAIVTGENIYTHQERDPSDLVGGAIRGTQEVATPVIFGVLTTIAAFAPFALIGGHIRFMAIGVSGVMMVALGFSLVESKLVLPSHLAYGSGVGRPAGTRLSKTWSRFQAAISRGLTQFVAGVYAPAVRRCIEWRYVTAAVSGVVFVFCLSLLGSGHIQTSMMPTMIADSVWAKLTMPLGTPVAETQSAIARLEAAAAALGAELDANRRPGEPPVMKHTLSMVGEHSGGGPSGGGLGAGRSHLGQVSVELSPSEVRSASSPEIANRWREGVGAIPGAEELTFAGQFRRFGDPIVVELRGEEASVLEDASAAVAEALAYYPGVFDIRDSSQEGKQELKLSILPGAEALGLSLEDVGRQVRQAFYGAEVQRIQRGRDEVKVMVRYPASERRSLADVENMRIRLGDGTAVPFRSVASAEMSRGPSSIVRKDRFRTVSVSANVDGDTNANEIVAQLESEVLPAILVQHPGVTYVMEGEQKEQGEALAGFRRAFIVALLTIYALLAIPLRSYLQPIFIMTVIPFGYVGAVVGHLITGTGMSMFSFIGVLAAAGVVVNDSLVLVTFLNRMREAGTPLEEAAERAGQIRFRAIMLTSLTTFAGLTPIMLDGTTQAQFVIPMAISLSFGVLVASVFTLLLVPSVVLIAEDLKRVSRRAVQRVGAAASHLVARI